MKPPSDYALNWERIFGAQDVRGSIYLLPSEAGAFIVQFEPDLRISALLPPNKREIEIEYKIRTRRNIESPHLILSQVFVPHKSVDVYHYFQPYYHANPEKWPEIDETRNHFGWCHCQYCVKDPYKHARVLHQFFIYAVEPTREDGIFAQPYRLNNVYEDARCCFTRRGETRAPTNLRQANAKFWMDRFSNEFQPPGEVWRHNCDNKAHAFLEHDYEDPCSCICCTSLCHCGCLCALDTLFADHLSNYKPSKVYEDYTSLICGQQFISFPRSAEAVFISHDKKILDAVPEPLIRKSRRYPERFVVGLATQNDAMWDIDLQGMEFSLNKSQVQVMQ